MKIRRRRLALRFAAGAVSLGVASSIASSLRASELSFTGAPYYAWEYAGNWSTNQLPTTGDIADIFAPQQVNYNVVPASSPVLQAVQIAGGNASSPAILYLENGTLLQVSRGIYLGGSVTNQNNSNTSPGQIEQSFGQVQMSSGSLLKVDSISTYQLGSSGQLFGGTEQLAGIFSQSGSSTNIVAGGMALNNSGAYTLQNSAQLSADFINNTAVFNQSGGTVLGTTTGTTFNNSGTYLYSSGSFVGSITNNPGATLSLNGASIPFSQGIVNNGVMTVTNAGGNYAGPISGTGTLNFNGSQNITLTGTNPFNGSTGVNGGTLTLAAPGGGALQGSVTVNAAATLVFAANAQFAGSVALLVSGGTVNLVGFSESVASLNQSGGQFNLTVGGSLNADTVISSGTFNQSNANVAGANSANTTFNNSGTYLYSGGTFTGFFTNNLGATVNITGGSIPFSQGIVNNGSMIVAGATGSYAGPISGNGTLNFNSSQSVTLTGQNSFNGSTGIYGGTLTLSSPTGGALLGPVTVAAGGTLAFGADAQLTPAALLTLNGGTVNLAANNQSIGTLALNAGQFNLTGTGYLSAAGEQIAGKFNQANASFNVLAGGATLNVTGSYLLQNTAVLDAGAIQNTGIFNQSGGTIQGVSTTAAHFNNSASFLFSGGNITATLTNNPAATLNASGGIFNGSLNNTTGATTSISGGNFNASVTNNTGGLLLLLSSGTITGSVNNSGIYNASGGSATEVVTNNMGATYLFTGGTFAGTVLNSAGATYNCTGGSSTGSVNNSTGAAFLYSGGTFTGSFINSVGATMSITNRSAGATVPFSAGILDNGQMTVTGINATYSGPISGSGSIIFNGSAMATLAGVGSFNGSTSINSGTLILAATGGPALQGNVTVAAAGTLAFGANSQLASSTLLTVNSGAMDLNAYSESIGSLAMNAGQIVQSGGQPLDVVSGSVMIGKGSASISGGLLTNSTYNFNVANNATLAILGPLSGSTATSATGLVLTGGGGILSIYGNSLLSSIDIKQGILQLSEGGTLGGDNLAATVESAGTLSLYGETLTIGDLLGSGAVALGSGSLYVSSSAAGSTFAGTINGSGSLFKSGTGTLTLTGTDSASGSTTTNVGTLTLVGSGSIGSGSITAETATVINLSGAVTGNPQVAANGTVNFGANSGTGFLQRSIGGLSVGSNSTAGNGQVNIALALNHANRTVLVTTSLSFAGAANSWSGQLDLSNNDMVVRNGNLATLTNQVKSGFNLSAGGNWKGNGITSSAAAANTTHLTALGVIQNNNGFSQPLYGSGAALGLFDGYSPAVSDVLVKYTYFGDANLDGKVDGTDYSLIDNGYLNKLTGWFNGDFNYDGVIDGSDYTLIDNAFNTQGSSLADEIALPTSQIDIALPQSTGVPEPAMLGMLGLGLLCSRRGRRDKS